MKSVGTVFVVGLFLMTFALAPPGRAQEALFVAPSGNVGIGTINPSAVVHVSRSNGTAKILVEESNGTATLRNLMTLRNNGGVQFLLDRTDGQNDWQFANFGTSFAVSVPGSVSNQMTLTAGGNMTISGTNYNTGSSRDLKERFVPVDGVEILRRVVAMPLTQWSAKNDPEVRHIGPVAEDWWESFGLGSDDKHVSMTDLGGVALAAIKGLHQEVAERDSLIAELQRRNDELGAQQARLLERLAALEAKLERN